MTESSIRVVVADDHAVVREGIRHVLERAPRVEVVGEAADGHEALAVVEGEAPDVVVLDVSMPGLTGLEVTQRLREQGSTIGILILSMFDDPEYVLQAMRAGADGYVLKDAGPAELREAVQVVNDGSEYLSERVTHQLSVALRSELEEEHRRSRLDQLTRRELEVLLRVAKGQTAREIGEEFGISHRTVETHRERVMTKLRIRTIAGLTRFVLETGIGDGRGENPDRATP
jgi:DNA-binding NarL/FixJ family response regulator